jgi:rhodanese-related sulfurtransferase
MIKNITPLELREWVNEGKEFSLVDVRENWEHAAFNIGGRLVPLGELMGAVDGIDRERPVVIYCEKGIRSVIAVQRLEGMGFENLYNLVGGMKGWRAG